MDNTSMYILAVLRYASPMPGYRVMGTILIYNMVRPLGRGVAIGRVAPTPDGPRIKGFWKKLRQLQDAGLVSQRTPYGYQLTRRGLLEAEKAVRELRSAGEDVTLLARVARLAQSLSHDEYRVLFAETVCGASCRRRAREQIPGYDAIKARIQRYIPRRRAARAARVPQHA